MKKFRKEDVVEKRDKLTSIICNKCGKNQELEDEFDLEINKFQTINLSFGYGSKYDMEYWNFDLCEECVTDLVKSFKYAPNGFGEKGVTL